jgi:plasmid stabilization system protein ParE
VKRLILTEIAKSDLASIRRYSTRTWGRHQTSKYIDDLRDTMKGLVRGTVITRARDDLRPGVLMAPSGRHSIFFEPTTPESWWFAFSTAGWTTADTWAPLTPTMALEAGGQVIRWLQDRRGVWPAHNGWRTAC